LHCHIPRCAWQSGTHDLSEDFGMTQRDFVGYGATPPDPYWPGGKHLALNIVLNYEEGSEPSFANGDGFTETGLIDGGVGGPVRETAARLGVRRPVGYFCVCSLTEGGCVAWKLRLVKTGAEGEGPCTDVMEINRPGDLADIANLGLTLSEVKRLLAGVRREIVAAQAREHAVRRPDCSCCGGVCRVKDYRDHAVATLFGEVTVRLPRFRCAACGGIEAGVG